MLDAYLQCMDADYNPQVGMVSRTWHHAGYHTKVPAGARVHPTRDALQYALGLLQAGGQERVDRAATVIRAVVALQDTDPLNPTYGIWPWLLEEPLEQMDRPDWNWADFLGARLATILADHAAALPADVADAARVALGHAAWSIFRRNVHLDYTNIAIMGAGVTAAAGELLDEPRLLDYARRRIQRLIERLDWHDGFPEYNSPTYTIVAVQECDRIVHLVRDAAVRDGAEHLRQAAWQLIAEHFHVGTGQWAGPHARAYSDHLRPLLLEYLRSATGADIRVHPDIADSTLGEANLIPPVPCPQRWRNRFTESADAPVELRRRCMRLEHADDRVGTTWMAADATLGSISHEDLWTQRRAVLAYWRTPDDPAVVLRLRFLHDDRDFASAYVRTHQQGPRVLAAVTMLTDRGDFHPYFNHPEDHRFIAEDLRLRWEFTGKGISARRLDHDRIALIAGPRQAVIHTPAGRVSRFGDQAVEWEVSQDDGRICVDAICHRGAAVGFDFRTFPPVVLVTALELLDPGEPPTDTPIEIPPPQNDVFQARWRDLQVTFPAAAHPYPT